MYRFRRRARKGFTLVELMTATGIMVGLMSMVFLITHHVLRAWDTASGRLSTNQQARVAFEQLSNDLESSVFRDDGKVWMEISFDEAGEGNIELPPPPQVMFFAPVGDEFPTASGTLPDTVCAVKYSLLLRSVFDPDIFTADPESTTFNLTYGLYRAVIDPSATFHGPLNPTAGLGSPGDYWARNDLEGREQFIVPAGSKNINPAAPGTYASHFSNLLASNIVDIRISLGGFPAEESGGGGARQLVDYDDGISGNPGEFRLTPATIESLQENPNSGLKTIKLSNRTFTGGQGAGATQIAAGLPAYIDLTMTVVSPDGAREIRALAGEDREVDPQARFQEIVLKKGHTFTRRIFLETAQR
jgi:prepilin-type N-terminal cleavage/methylation domain-containing protein